MGKPYDIKPQQSGYHDYWLATGELRDTRFALPGGTRDVTFTAAHFHNVNFSGQTFASFSAHDSLFERCAFSEVVFDSVSFGATCHGGRRWDETTWPATVYRECVFARTWLPVATPPFLGNARFERCVFDRARLRGLTSTFEAEFVDCTFRGKLREVNFWGRPESRYNAALGRSSNDFRGNDFTEAELVWVAFHHIDLRAQRLPGGTEYALVDNVGARVAAALAVVETWPESAAKTGARFALEFHAEQVKQYGHRDEALIARAQLGLKLPPDVRDTLFDLLSGYNDHHQ